ncbi:hypothetical protein SAMN05877753_106158 [Bacillus oleivorans]|uniref:DUF4386 family protein n=1 Tax=Bacillus oleivorans TaxID=1448271 RepID=A0A285CZZ9_9BACI|nr:hypothetical protein [Bacillus oleivorans]SNX72648.1 hypothetical protein SAMN05877753_106158 [Bacillus oleivorans]
MQISQKFFRFTGIILIIGALLAATGHLLKPQPPTSGDGIEAFISQSMLSDTLLVIGVPIVILGLVGIFVRQSERLPTWGWIGYPAIGIGLIYADLIQPVIRLIAYPFVLADVSTEEEIYTAVTTIYDQDPFGFMFPVILLSMIGPILSAISFWKAKVFPVWLAIMMLLLLPIFLISPMVGFYNFPAYLYVVIGIYGVKLITDKSGLESSVPEQAIVVTK